MMEKEATPSIGFFEKYLTVWVLMCMIIGVLIGNFLPAIPSFLNKFTYAQVSIPIAILIWLMIYPMMLKVDFKSVKNVRKNPKGLFVTWVVNWIIKPFTMFGISSFFFYVIFKNFIPYDIAKDYLIGAVLLGAAPCTAMVFVWSHLCKDANIKSLKESWLDSTTTTGKLMFTIMAGLSQFEGDIISQRTKEGLASARARGKFGGRKTKLDDAKMREFMTCI